jgi:hypothetical protein
MAKSFSNIHRPDIRDLARPSMARSVAGKWLSTARSNTCYIHKRILMCRAAYELVNVAGVTGLGQYLLVSVLWLAAALQHTVR